MSRLWFSRRKLHPRAPRGFTLLELMVSMTVLVMLVVMLLGMVDAATKMWRQNENRVDSYREARAALNVMAADLASIAVSANTNFFRLDTNNNTLSFLTATSPSYQDSGDNSSKNKSDLCQVTYSWSFERPNPLSANSVASYNLFRTFVSSTDTFEDIRNDTLFESAPKEALARNIAKFKIQAFTTNTTGGTTTLDEFVQSDTTPMPDLLVITVDALNNEAVKRFTGEGSWKDTNAPTYKENVRTFTARIHLPVKEAKTLASSPSPTPSSSSQ